MPRITKLKLQKNKRVVNVFIDDQFTTSLDLITISKLGFKEGVDISSHDLQEIIQKSNQEKLSNFTLRFLSYRPRSKKEIRTYLLRKIKTGKIKGAEEKDIQNLFKNLEKKGIIDDRKFAKWWIEQRLKFRPKGKLLLKIELQMKGIDKEFIEDLLKPKDDLSAARKVAQKKKKTIKSERDPQKAKKKLIGLLARRGFTWPTIKTVVDETLAKK